MLTGGYWFCRTCRGPADIEDPGEAYPRCVRCGERGLVWTHVVEGAIVDGCPASAVAATAVTRGLEWARLPVERRSLRRLANEGYYFCRGCGCVSDATESGACVLCGASGLEWCAPVF